MMQSYQCQQNSEILQQKLYSPKCVFFKLEYNECKPEKIFQYFEMREKNSNIQYIAFLCQGCYQRINDNQGQSSQIEVLKEEIKRNNDFENKTLELSEIRDIKLYRVVSVGNICDKCQKNVEDLEKQQKQIEKEISNQQDGVKQALFKQLRDKILEQDIEEDLQLLTNLKECLNKKKGDERQKILIYIQYNKILNKYKKKE